MVLLTAHVLNGQIMGVDIPVNSIIRHPFKIETSPSIGYVDVSSVKNWWVFGRDLGRDYLYVRDRIKNIINQKGIDDCISTLSSPPSNPTDNDRHYVDKDEVATGDWAGYEGWTAIWNEDLSKWWFEPTEWVGYRTLNQEEKDIAAQIKIGSQADHFADYGVPSIVNYGFDYHKKSRSTRQERMMRAVVEVYNIIPLNVGEALTNITASPLGDMYTRYIEFGVKGTAEDYNKDFNPNPTPGIADWLLSRATFSGVEPYASAGFPIGLSLKPWVPIDGSTIQEFADKVYGILVKGDLIS